MLSRFSDRGQPNNRLERAMQEIASQRELFWQPRARRVKRLPHEWREAIERGEELLRDVQRRKIESNGVSFSLL